MAERHRATAPPAAADSPWQVLGDEYVAHSSRWGRYGSADVARPSGERGKHHWFELPPAAMTVALDNDRVLMAWRHRWVPDLWSWELPGGLVAPHEDPADTAARELTEETGYTASRPLELLATYEPAAGSLRSPHHVYLAEHVERTGHPSERDEGEFRWLPLAEMPEKIARGQLGTSGSLTGVLLALQRKH
ncbi:NUDIX hydrolase [Prauserella sp. PE36]|nr:NUDIX hydrolase [Prauserella sp. PE36]